jgi:hypothetical protein
MEHKDFISRFGQYVDAREATVLVGAGLSQSVGFPDWFTLIEPLRAELGIDRIEDLPQLAQYFVDNVADGRRRLNQHLVETFAAVGDPAPARAHSLLAELPISEFWTTNYDELLERSILDATTFVKDSDLAGLVEPGLRRIYKMHGTVNVSDECVLTRDDYERYPTTHPRFWQLLQAQFLTQSFLFLGFGFSDPNLELVFKLVRLITPDIKREHFAVMKQVDETETPEKTAERARLLEMQVKELERVGVNVVMVERYEEIDEILGKLVARCRPPQVMISGSAPGDVKRTAAPGAYPTAEIPEGTRAIATAIGERFAQTGIAAVAAGELGAVVGYEMMRKLDARGAYDSGRFTLVRRQRDEELGPPNTRFGRVVFTGGSPVVLRSVALGEVRALLVLGGGDGTQHEIDQAAEVGLGVIPVGCTGGTAETWWLRMQQDLGNQVLGGRPIDPVVFADLMSEAIDKVAEAAARLVAQALFFDYPPMPTPVTAPA